MSARRKPRSPASPPKVYPKLLCIGGPRDGEIVSQLDLPMDGFINVREPSRLRVKMGTYVKIMRKEGIEPREIWLWKEVESVR